MSIRFAFSTLACPEWPLPQAIEQAKAMGYQGIELVTRFGRNTPTLACDPQQADLGQIKTLLAQADIEPVCLTTNLSFSAPGDEQEQASLQMARSAIEQAAALGAPAVRVLAWDIPRGEIDRQTLDRVARRARLIADFAGMRGVQVLFENIGAFPAARDWWWCLDVIRHPMVGLLWNAMSAATAAGEKPAVSIPMLNSRIRLAKVTDFKRSGGQLQRVPLGDGELNLPLVLHRLMGVGFTGYVSVEWDRLANPSLASAQEILPEARKRLTGLLEEVLQAAEAKKPPKKTLPAAAAALAAKAAKAGVAKSVSAGVATAEAEPEAQAAEAASAAKSLPDAAAARAAKLAAAKAKAEARLKASEEATASDTSSNQAAEDSPAASTPSTTDAPPTDPAAIRAAKLAAAKAKAEARLKAKEDASPSDNSDADTAK